MSLQIAHVQAYAQDPECLALSLLGALTTSTQATKEIDQFLHTISTLPYTERAVSLNVFFTLFKEYEQTGQSLVYHHYWRYLENSHKTTKQHESGFHINIAIQLAARIKILPQLDLPHLDKTLIPHINCFIATKQNKEFLKDLLDLDSSLPAARDLSHYLGIQDRISFENHLRRIEGLNKLANHHALRMIRKEVLLHLINLVKKNISDMSLPEFLGAYSQVFDIATDGLDLTDPRLVLYFIDELHNCLSIKFAMTKKEQTDLSLASRFEMTDFIRYIGQILQKKSFINLSEGEIKLKLLQTWQFQEFMHGSARDLSKALIGLIGHKTSTLDDSMIGQRVHRFAKNSRGLQATHLMEETFQHEFEKQSLLTLLEPDSLQRKEFIEKLHHNCIKVHAFMVFFINHLFNTPPLNALDCYCEWLVLDMTLQMAQNNPKETLRIKAKAQQFISSRLSIYLDIIMNSLNKYKGHFPTSAETKDALSIDQLSCALSTFCQLLTHIDLNTEDAFILSQKKFATIVSHLIHMLLHFRQIQTACSIYIKTYESLKMLHEALVDKYTDFNEIKDWLPMQVENDLNPEQLRPNLIRHMQATQTSPLHIALQLLSLRAVTPTYEFILALPVDLKTPALKHIQEKMLQYRN